MSGLSLKECRVCGEAHDLPTPATKRRVTITFDNAMAHRMLSAACRLNDWALVDALVHALSTGETTEVDDRL